MPTRAPTREVSRPVVERDWFMVPSILFLGNSTGECFESSADEWDGSVG